MSHAPESRFAFPPNPYVIGVPLTGNVGFYGRNDVFQFINETLDAGQQRVILLYGQRRVGKTSILHQTIRRLAGESALLPVYFDLQGKGCLSLSQVLFQLAREIARTADLGNPPEAAFDEAGNFFAEQVLPQTYARLGSQRRLLLLFDEFDVLGDEIRAAGASETAHPLASETLFPYLQNLIMQHERLAFIFVVGRRIDELPTHFNAIFKQAAYRRIGLMRPDDAREMIVEPLRGIIAVHDEVVQAILDLTAGHPYFTQLLCSEAYNHMRQQDQRELSGGDIPGFVEQAIETGHGALTWFWEGIPRAERFILSAIAHVSDEQGVASKVAIQRILEKHRIVLSGLELQDAPERLAEWEILRRKGADAYCFTVDLVRCWMLKEHPLESARRDVDLISKRAVRLFDNARDTHMSGDLEQARNDYRAVLVANPNHSGAQLGLAQVSFELGDLEAAIEAFERAYAIDEMSARDGLALALVALGQKHEEAGQQTEALAAYQKALQYTPHDETLRRKLANIWLSRASAEGIVAGSLANADRAYREALSFDTDGNVATKIRLDFDTWVRQAESEQRHEDVVAAFNLLQRLLAEDVSVNEAEYYCRRGDKLVSAGDRGEAIHAYERALELRPDDATVLAKLDSVSIEWRKLLEVENIFNKGFVAQQEGDWETAKTCWVQLIKIDVLDYQSHDVVRLLWEAKQRVPAGALLEQVVKVTKKKEVKETDLWLGLVGVIVVVVLTPVIVFRLNSVTQGVSSVEESYSSYLPDKTEKEIPPVEESPSEKIRAEKELTPEESYQQGKQLYGSRLYEQARLKLEIAAKEGHASAQNDLGTLYANALGVSQDFWEAVNWFRMAAEQGDPTAQNNLGMMYKNGMGVEKSRTKAVKWFRLAAEQGDIDGQYNLGVAYLNDGSKKTDPEGVSWLRKSAKQGHSGAQAELEKLRITW